MGLMSRAKIRPGSATLAGDRFMPWWAFLVNAWMQPMTPLFERLTEKNHALQKAY